MPSNSTLIYDDDTDSVGKSMDASTYLEGGGGGGGRRGGLFFPTLTET